MELMFSAQVSKEFKITSSVKICLVRNELFDADRQPDRQTERQTDRQTLRSWQSLYSIFRTCVKYPNKYTWQNVCKSIAFTLNDSLELVKFCNRIYQLPIQWPCNIFRIEQSGINDNNLFKFNFLCVYVCIYVSKYTNTIKF